MADGWVFPSSTCPDSDILFERTAAKLRLRAAHRKNVSAHASKQPRTETAWFRCRDMTSPPPPTINHWQNKRSAVSFASLLFVMSRLNPPSWSLTLFEDIAAGRKPSSKIYEDDSVFAFLDISPLSKGHCLVIPKTKYTFLDEVPDEIDTALAQNEAYIELSYTIQNSCVSVSTNLYKTYELLSLYICILITTIQTTYTQTYKEPTQTYMIRL